MEEKNNKKVACTCTESIYYAFSFHFIYYARFKWPDEYSGGNLVVKNSPSNAGDAGSFPGRGIKIPRAAKPMHHNERVWA